MSGTIPPDVIAEAVAAAKAWLRLENDEGVLGGLAGTAIVTAEAFLGSEVVARDGSVGWGRGAGADRARGGDAGRASVRTAWRRCGAASGGRGTVAALSTGAAVSARAVLQAAIVARLGTVAGLRAFDAPPVRGGVPYAVVDEPVLQQADAAGIAGRTGTVSILSYDSGERPVRLRKMSASAEDAVEALSGDLGEGWRLVGVRLVRSRIARTTEDRWRGMSEFAVRLYRES